MKLLFVCLLLSVLLSLTSAETKQTNGADSKIKKLKSGIGDSSTAVLSRNQDDGPIYVMDSDDEDDEDEDGQWHRPLQETTTIFPSSAPIAFRKVCVHPWLEARATIENVDYGHGEFMVWAGKDEDNGAECSQNEPGEGCKTLFRDTVYAHDDSVTIFDDPIPGIDDPRQHVVCYVIKVYDPKDIAIGGHKIRCIFETMRPRHDEGGMAFIILFYMCCVGPVCSMCCLCLPLGCAGYYCTRSNKTRRRVERPIEVDGLAPSFTNYAPPTGQQARPQQGYMPLETDYVSDMQNRSSVGSFNGAPPLYQAQVNHNAQPQSDPIYGL